jgi:cytochrome P450
MIMLSSEPQSRLSDDSFVQTRARRKPGVQAPGPSMLSFFRRLREFKRDPLACFFASTLKYGDVVRYRSLWITHQLSNPAHIQHVLQSNFANYRKGRDYRILRSSLGEGLLTSEGALWQRQRKMTQPALHGQQVASFIGIMERSTLALLERWEHRASQGEVFDIVPDLMHLTLNIASQALFTTSLESETEIIRETLAIGRDYSVDQAWSVVRLPQSVPTPGNRRYSKGLAAFHGVIDRMIVARRAVHQKTPDLLTLLMEARDEEGRPMSDKQLRDEVATLLTAGHETTTLALSWACYLLARHPQVQERLRPEFEFLRGGAPGYENLSRLRYSRMVVDETMRLYPPVWVISRQAIADDEIGGYRIPAGSEILMFPYITHRHPKWWPEPEKFLPERFAPENAPARQKFAYVPFGAGPRACVGLNFAMTEILVVLALLLQRFHLDPVPEAPSVSADPSVTLRPLPGIYVRLAPAKAQRSASN